MRRIRVASGTSASSAWRTIGARVPSTSRRTAARDGSSRKPCSASSSVWTGGTRPSMPPMPSRRTLQLGLIGTLAGLFSGLFGVGGGTVIVPLLVLWLGYEERMATATSLAAIILIASVAAPAQAIYGNVHWGDAALVGIPAMAGVVVGTSVQQRVPQRRLSQLFAILLVAVAIDLVVK